MHWLLWEFEKMADNLLNFNFQRLTLMNAKKKISRVYRNIRNNLVMFADNLPFGYFKAPQTQQRFDGK